MNIMAQGYFSIIDDDANSVGAISSIKEVAEQKGIKITFAVKAASVCQTKDVCKLLLQYQEEGYQIVNHSLTHDKSVWKSPRYEVIVNELIRTGQILDSLGFRNHDYFVYPWGKFDSDVREWMMPLISEHFKLAFDSRGGATDLNDYNRYYIHRFPLRKHDNISIVKHEIEKAVEKGEWIVFLTHSGMERDFEPEYVGDVIEYCLQKKMACLTVKDAYEMLENTNALRADATKDWTLVNEILYLMYMHIWWILSVVGFIMCTLIIAKYLYLYFSI